MEKNKHHCQDDRRSLLDILDDPYHRISLDLVSDETLRRFCNEANIAYRNNRCENIENLRTFARDTMPSRTHQSYKNGEGPKAEEEGSYVNHFTPVNKIKLNSPIVIPEETRRIPGDAPSPLIDWAARDTPIVAIQREYTARNLPMETPLHISEPDIRSRYGKMLTELDRMEKGDDPVVGRERSLSPQEMSNETKQHKDTFRVRDYTNALHYESSVDNSDLEEEEIAHHDYHDQDDYEGDDEGDGEPAQGYNENQFTQRDLPQSIEEKGEMMEE